MGRKKTPAKLKLLSGNPGHRPIQNEPAPATDIPKMPTFLNDEAKTEWQRICPLLEELGIVSQIDRAALAAYCQAYARWKEFEALVDAADRSQPDFLALARAARQQAILMKGFLSEFGMTPSARSKVNITEKKLKSAYEAWKSGKKDDE
jgi:P27 family predicted phage terminase small subunit